MEKVFDYNNSFILKDPLANRPFRLDPFDQEWIHNLDAWSLFKGDTKPTQPILLKVAMGGQATDFLWARLTPIVCISQRVVDLLVSHNFKGWLTYPVEIFDRKGIQLTGYHGFGIKSSVGEDINDIDTSRSPIVTKPPVVPGGKPPVVYRGLYFDESKWGGSDIFRIIGIKIVTAKVRDVFIKNRITNVHFMPLLEYEVSVESHNILKREIK